MKSEVMRISHELQAQKEKIKENAEKIKVNKTLPYLVSNVIEVIIHFSYPNLYVSAVHESNWQDHSKTVHISLLQISPLHHKKKEIGTKELGYRTELLQYPIYISSLKILFCIFSFWMWTHKTRPRKMVLTWILIHSVKGNVQSSKHQLDRLALFFDTLYLKKIKKRISVRVCSIDKKKRRLTIHRLL